MKQAATVGKAIIDPMDWYERVNHHSNLIRHLQKFDLNNQLSGELTQAEIDNSIQKEIDKLWELSPLHAVAEKLHFALENNPQPYRTLVKIRRELARRFFVFFHIVCGLGFLVIRSVDWLGEKLVNFMSNGYYNEITETIKKQKHNEAVNNKIDEHLSVFAITEGNREKNTVRLERELNLSHTQGKTDEEVMRSLKKTYEDDFYIRLHLWLQGPPYSYVVKALARVLIQWPQAEKTQTNTDDEEYNGHESAKPEKTGGLAFQRFLFVLTWPLRLAVVLALGGVLTTLRLTCNVLGIVTILIDFAFQFVSASISFVLNIPQGIYYGPGYLWRNRKDIARGFGKALLYPFKQAVYHPDGLLLAAGVAAFAAVLSFATFGMVPLLIGVAAGTGLLIGGAVQALNVLQHPVLKLFLGLSLLAVGGALVAVSFGAATPLIAVQLPWVLPAALQMQLLIVSGIGAGLAITFGMIIPAILEALAETVKSIKGPDIAADNDADASADNAKDTTKTSNEYQGATADSTTPQGEAAPIGSQAGYQVPYESHTKPATSEEVPTHAPAGTPGAAQTMSPAPGIESID